MSKPRRIATTALAALLLGVALSAPAWAVDLDASGELGATLSSWFDGLVDFLASAFRGSKGSVYP